MHESVQRRVGVPLVSAERLRLSGEILRFGVVGTVGAALLGFLIGQAFDGTVQPFLIGVALCAAGGFVIVVLTEPRRLFAPITSREEPPSIADDLA